MPNRAITLKFHPYEVEALLPGLVLGVMTLLRCSGMETGHELTTMTENLSMAIGQLLDGVNQTSQDPLAMAAFKS